MQLDMFGKKRFKVNLHMHTTDSDGKLSPEEALDVYLANGFDAVAITEHWGEKMGGVHKGMTVLAGCEYNTTYRDSMMGVYHILGIGIEQPSQGIVADDPPQKIIDEIHRIGGIAILAHPAWSLNAPDQILPLRDVDATEIYNSVSGVHYSRRADSSYIIDLIASRGRYYPLLAADDAHYYDNDACIGWIMVEAESNAKEDLLPAIREGKFYATQGPEVHFCKEGDEYVVRCSPASEIRFFSNSVFSYRVFEGEGLTEARYTPQPIETYLRAEVVDANGKSAWSHIIPIPTTDDEV